MSKKIKKIEDLSDEKLCKFIRYWETKLNEARNEAIMRIMKEKGSKLGGN